MEHSEEISRKRRKLNGKEDEVDIDLTLTQTSSISPPPLRRARRQEVKPSRIGESSQDASVEDTGSAKINLFPQRRMKTEALRPSGTSAATDSQNTRVSKSPFQLTWIRDLPESLNHDAISLKDILGDPMIAECWNFNYLHDLDFLMDAFDADVRDMIKVHVVHGFWKNEDESRLRLIEQAKKYPNLKLLTAYMPEMFGTHHSKMLVLLRHDDTAQIIIHTANMIAFDWTNLTQAVWMSPLLQKATVESGATQSSKVGSGSKFKIDFLNYLRAYNTKRTICKALIEQITKYDFSSIRASLVASVPGRQAMETGTDTLWGWAGLRQALREVPVKSHEPDIVVQISSIATLGATDKWLDQTLFKILSTSKNKSSKPKFHVIFPTADEIRRSLNGYASGSAIHVKIQSSGQAKQLQYLKPMLCHWAGDAQANHQAKYEAGRRRAAPHIKTYIRFTDSSHDAIDWMLVTSANLSKQAWGEAPNATGEVRICSYEIGVLVWPELYGDEVTMVPTFRTDTPTVSAGDGAGLVMGARMPYDLPLVPYGRDDAPWVATASYEEPDWMGQSYNCG